MNTPDIPSPTELASIADDLEKQTESVNQLEFLVTILDKLTEESIEHIREMLALKATKAVGRA
jgi:hypothetical protein